MEPTPENEPRPDATPDATPDRSLKLSRRRRRMLRRSALPLLLVCVVALSSVAGVAGVKKGNGNGGKPNKPNKPNNQGNGNGGGKPNKPGKPGKPNGGHGNGHGNGGNGNGNGNGNGGNGNGGNGGGKPKPNTPPPGLAPHDADLADGATPSTPASGQMLHDSGDAVTEVGSKRAKNANSLYDLCKGYKEPRIPLEGHEWWFPTTVGGVRQNGRPLGHLHTTSCSPVGQTITNGKLKLKVNMMAHNANAEKGLIVRVKKVDIMGKDATGLFSVDTFDKNWLFCDYSKGRDCSSTASVTVDLVNSPRAKTDPDDPAPTGGFRSNGRKQLRVTEVAELVDKRTGKVIASQRAILRYPIVLDLPQLRGRPNSDFVVDGGSQIETAGWFRSVGGTLIGGYVTPNLLSGMPIQAVAANATLSFPMKFDADPCDLCLVKKTPLSGYSVHLDPTFPDGVGTVVSRVAFAPGTVSATGTVTVNLGDPRFGTLKPGLHKIVVKLRQPMVGGNIPNDLQATNQGSMHIPFIVR